MPQSRLGVDFTFRRISVGGRLQVFIPGASGREVEVNVGPADASGGVQRHSTRALRAG